MRKSRYTAFLAFASIGARSGSSCSNKEDYQTVPTLNFRNFVSEDEAEKNLELLDSIYEPVHTSAASFLNAEELVKFAEFRKLAINNNRVGLALNRKLMAPAPK